MRKILSRGRFFRRPAKKSGRAPGRLGRRRNVVIGFLFRRARKKSGRIPGRLGREKSSRAENPANLAAPPGGEAGPGTRVPVATFLHDLLVLAWTSRGRCEKNPAGPRPARRVRKILSRLAGFLDAAKKIRPGSWPARPAAKCHARIFGENPAAGFFIPAGKPWHSVV